LGREGSQLRTISEAVDFIDNAPKGNDPLEYIFGDLLESFNENETKVLAALTHFAQPAKLKWLAELTNLPERAAETALEDLNDRSILVSNIESRTFYLPPLTAKFIKTRRPEAVTQTGDALTLQYGGESKDYEKFPMLDAEWDFISAAERDTNEALRIANIIKNDERITYYTSNLAGLALDREQWAAAEILAREALALAERLGGQEAIAVTSNRLAQALLKQNHNLDEALSLSHRAVEIYTRLRHPNLQSAQETLAEIEEKIKEK
jgi:hypothetical protein